MGDTMESSTNNIATFEEKRSRTVSNAVEGADGEGVDCSHSSKVDDVEICCAGIRGSIRARSTKTGSRMGMGRSYGTLKECLLLTSELGRTERRSGMAGIIPMADFWGMWSGIRQDREMSCHARY